MSISNFLLELRRHDIHIWLDADRLRCNAATEALTPELRMQLQQRKDEIVEFLRSAQSLARQQKAIVPLQPNGARVPIFAVAGHNGDIYCYRALAARLGRDQPFFGLQPPGFEGECAPLASVENLAAHFAAQVCAFRPQGPCIIAGFCAGGCVAFELARQLRQAGVDVTFVALFGSPYPWFFRLPRQALKGLADRVATIGSHLREMSARPLREWRSYIDATVRRRRGRIAGERAQERDPALANRIALERATLAAVRRYSPGWFDGRLVLFLPSRAWCRSGFLPLRWQAHARLTDEYFGPADCDSDNMLREPHVHALAAQLRDCCGRRPDPHPRFGNKPARSPRIRSQCDPCQNMPRQTSQVENSS